MREVQIVVIEDNPADVLLIEKALEASHVPHRTHRYEDGEEALDALCPVDRIATLRPDLILLDLNLPRSEGMDVLRKIRQHQDLKATPVAVLSSSEEEALRASEMGADRFITKPIQLAAFLAEVGGGVRDLLVLHQRV